MIDYSTYCQIHSLQKHAGLNSWQIARELDLTSVSGNRLGAVCGFEQKVAGRPLKIEPDQLRFSSAIELGWRQKGRRVFLKSLKVDFARN